MGGVGFEISFKKNVKKRIKTVFQETLSQRK